MDLSDPYAPIHLSFLPLSEKGVQRRRVWEKCPGIVTIDPTLSGLRSAVASATNGSILHAMEFTLALSEEREPGCLTRSQSHETEHVDDPDLQN